MAGGLPPNGPPSGMDTLGRREPRGRTSLGRSERRTSKVRTSRVRTVMENLEKSWNFKLFVSRPGKVLGKKFNSRSFGKVMDICYIHMFIYTV